MSFSVQHRADEIEFSGTGLNGLFAQRRNCIRPRFWNMLLQVVRFNRLGHRLITDNAQLACSLQEFIDQNRFSRSFLDHYLLPMTSAIWSTPPDEMLQFPAQSLLRFMFNHGLLGITTQHPWRTVVGGSRSYRDRILQPFVGKLHCATKAVHVRRLQDAGVELCFANGNTARFDCAVLATHADTSLSLLTDPHPDERRLLSAFNYADNRIALHSDDQFMPRARAAWASWNYRIDKDTDGRSHASTHYWMNSLQRVSDQTHYFVSVNPPASLQRDKVHRAFNFSHPMFDSATSRAQPELPSLNRGGPVYFCGSYFRYGFHEDALMAGYDAASSLLQDQQP